MSTAWWLGLTFLAVCVILVTFVSAVLATVHLMTRPWQ